MKKAICLLAAVLAFAGCSLGDVSEKGASCPPKNATHKATLGIIGGVDCTVSSCDVNGSDYTENIQFGYCPVEFSQCGYDSGKNVYYCAKIACMEDEHIYDDACEVDSVDHCGSHEMTAANGLGGEVAFAAARNALHLNVRRIMSCAMPIVWPIR